MPEAELVKAFCQVNTVKGYRYLDAAGEIMNAYDDQFDELQVGLDGLTMRRSGAVIDEAKVSTSQVWISFTGPDTVQYVVDQATRFVRFVTETLGVTACSRYGFRTQHLLPFAATDFPEAATKVIHYGLADRIPGRIDQFELHLDVDAQKDSGTKVRIGSAVRGEGMDPRFPKAGVLLDFDIWRKGTDLPSAGFRAFMQDGAKKMPDLVATMASLFEDK